MVHWWLLPGPLEKCQVSRPAVPFQDHGEGDEPGELTALLFVKTQACVCVCLQDYMCACVQACEWVYVCVCVHVYMQCASVESEHVMCVHVGPFACENLLCLAACSVPQDPEPFVSSIIKDLDFMVSLGSRPVLCQLVLL